MAADDPVVTHPPREPCAATPLYCHPDARALAARWDDGRFEIVESVRLPRCDGFFLWFGGEVLELCHGARRGAVHVSLAELTRRAAQGGALTRACGVTSQQPLDVLDALSGWGVDGLVLASSGCRVTLVERHPVLSALGDDLARRSGLHGVECVWGDGLRAIADGPVADVVYLDPLFPERSKQALPGKRLQWLAELATPDPRPLDEWLAAALAKARQRVVLKRRRHDPLARNPDWQIVGRTVRYDVFRGIAPGTRPITPPAAARSGCRDR